MLLREAMKLWDVCSVQPCDFYETMQAQHQSSDNKCNSQVGGIEKGGIFLPHVMDTHANPLSSMPFSLQAALYLFSPGRASRLEK